MELGQRLRQIRLEKQKTLRDVNESIGISYSNLAQIERGEHGCTIETLKLLADYYGVTYDYLIGKTSKPNAIQITYADADGVITNLEYELLDKMKGFDVEDFHKVLEYIDFLKTVKEKESDNDEKPS